MFQKLQFPKPDSTSFVRKRSIIFIAATATIITVIYFVLIYSLDKQLSDAKTINIAGRQRMLSQRISKLVLFLHYNQHRNTTSSVYTTDSLKKISNKWDSEYNYLLQQNLNNDTDKAFDSLFALNRGYQIKILTECRNILNHPESPVIKVAIDTIARYELPFLMSMEAIVLHYQNQAEHKLNYLKKIITVLALIAMAMLAGIYVLIILPVIRNLSGKNKELQNINEELTTTEEELRSSLENVNALKADIEVRANQSKIFIEQAPSAIAMFDMEMRYLAASQKWHQDYGLLGQQIIGKSHYEIFPEIGDDWKKIHQECLKGATNQRDEAYFERADGSEQWITWDVRPWHVGEGNIGGILMYTADITHIKQSDAEKRKTDEILNKINDKVRIGTWEFDLVKNKILWSKATKKIHEVAPDYEPNYESAIQAYKESSRLKIEKAVGEAIKKGKAFDLELELTTAKGNQIWTRTIGQGEFENGRCRRLYGIFQDITKAKDAEQAINKLNAELKAIFNSGFVSIIVADQDGVISHFNKGAEALLQYAAEEMIGKHTPATIHFEPEVSERGKALSVQYGKEISGFDVFVEWARQGKHESNKWTYVRKDGTTFPVQLVVTALKNEKGDIFGFLGIGIDISELEENRMQLLEAKEDLELLAKKLTYQNTQLANFAHITSHNLRSPISNLNSLAHFYKNSESEEYKATLFKKFETVIEHLSTTLNNLVDALKIKEEAGKSLEKLYFENMLVKIKEIIVGQLMESKATINFDFSKAPQIEYDPNYLESIFQNLLTNAIKYKSPDRNPEITIYTEIVDERIKLTVKDNGIGIDLAKHGNKLFGLHKTFHRHPDAKGVGLYLTKTHIDAMGGSITASSEVGYGTTFTIIF